MVDPTSDLNENVDETTAPDCAVCEASLLGDPGHRVSTRIVDGSVETVHCCSDACFEDWRG